MRIYLTKLLIIKIQATAMYWHAVNGIHAFIIDSLNVCIYLSSDSYRLVSTLKCNIDVDLSCITSKDWWHHVRSVCFLLLLGLLRKTIRITYQMTRIIQEDDYMIQWSLLKMLHRWGKCTTLFMLHWYRKSQIRNCRDVRVVKWPDNPRSGKCEQSGEPSW